MPRESPTKEREEREEIKWEDIEEKYFTSGRKKRRKKKEKSHKTKYLFAILVNLGLYYVFNNLFWGKFAFVTSDYFLVLPILNLSIGGTVFGNFFLLFYDNSRFKTVIRIIMNLLTILFLYKFYKVFPLNLSSVLVVHVIQILLIIGIVGLAALTFFEMAQLVFERPREK